MSQTFSIPSDVAAHLTRCATTLKAYKATLDREYDLWEDVDPDPENGDFWMVKIDHPVVDNMRTNMERVAEFLDWLAKFSDGGAE